VVPPVGGVRLEVGQAPEAALDGREIGEEAAEPPLIDVVHPTARRLCRDHVLSLPLGPDEEDRPALGCEVRHELLGIPEQLDRLVQVENVDAVPFAKDVLLHLRVPPFRLVAEVNARLQQILHRDRGQASSLSLCVLSGVLAVCLSVTASQRLLNWNRLRAPARPYFLRSLIRESV